MHLEELAFELLLNVGEIFFQSGRLVLSDKQIGTCGIQVDLELRVLHLQLLVQLAELLVDPLLDEGSFHVAVDVMLLGHVLQLLATLEEVLFGQLLVDLRLVELGGKRSQLLVFLPQRLVFFNQVFP